LFFDIKWEWIIPWLVLLAVSLSSFLNCPHISLVLRPSKKLIPLIRILALATIRLVGLMGNIPFVMGISLRALNFVSLTHLSESFSSENFMLGDSPDILDVIKLFP
jgi:hypothetical protein